MGVGGEEEQEQEKGEWEGEEGGGARGGAPNESYEHLGLPEGSCRGLSCTYRIFIKAS